jgi:hypothetical protein
MALTTATRLVVVCDAVLFFALPVLVLPWLLIAEARAAGTSSGPFGRPTSEAIRAERTPSEAIRAERTPSEAIRAERTPSEAKVSGPSLPSPAIQALFLGLRGVFCVAVAPALARSPAHLVLLAASLAHQGLAAAALALLAHLARLQGGMSGFRPAGQNHEPSDLVGFCNGLAFVGVVYVFSLAFGLRATERWLRGGSGQRQR